MVQSGMSTGLRRPVVARHMIVVIKLSVRKYLQSMWQNIGSIEEKEHPREDN